jgi:hypothetical protein
LAEKIHVFYSKQFNAKTGSRSWLIHAIHALYATSALVVRTPKSGAVLSGLFSETSAAERPDEPHFTVDSDVELGPILQSFVSAENVSDNFLVVSNPLCLLLLGPLFLLIVIFVYTTLLTGMTSNSLRMQWPPTAQSHGSQNYLRKFHPQIVDTFLPPKTTFINSSACYGLLSFRILKPYMVIIANLNLSNFGLIRKFRPKRFRKIDPRCNGRPRCPPTGS